MSEPDPADTIPSSEILRWAVILFVMLGGIVVVGALAILAVLKLF